MSDGEIGRARGGRARAEALTAEQRSQIAKKAAKSRWNEPRSEKADQPLPLSIVAYDVEGSPAIRFGFDADRQGLWATQADMAALYGVDVSQISRHIRNIFAEGELPEDGNLRKTQITSFKPTGAYSFDVIISVGYRVNSKVATKFRQWATQIIKTYLDQGYVINEKQLRESPEKLNKLAAEIRALRAAEKQVYAKVRDCFKLSSSDYDPSSKQVRSFYALLQDKFYHAVTGLTSSKLILDKANHRDDNMGLQTMDGKHPNLTDAQTGKNYLRSEELYRLHLLSEQFLLYAESTALAGRKMTMLSLHAQLDRLLTLNDYPVFEGYRDFIKNEAMSHARIELGLYKKRKKIEAMGVDYDEEALAVGEYDELLINYEEDDF